MSHKRNVHEKSKRHKCEYCNKWFFFKGQRDLHVLSVHEKMQMFECEICHKPFSSKQSLKNHTSSVHQNERQSCQLCCKEYSLTTYLKHIPKCKESYSTQHSTDKEIKK